MWNSIWLNVSWGVAIHIYNGNGLNSFMGLILHVMFGFCHIGLCTIWTCKSVPCIMTFRNQHVLCAQHILTVRDGLNSKPLFAHVYSFHWFYPVLNPVISYLCPEPPWLSGKLVKENRKVSWMEVEEDTECFLLFDSQLGSLDYQLIKSKVLESL